MAERQRVDIRETGGGQAGPATRSIRPGSLDRAAALTGFAFLGLLIASFIVGGSPPQVGAAPSLVVTFWRDHRGEQIVAALLGGFAAVFLVWFGGVVRATLTERAAGRLATTAFGGFLLIAAGGLALAGFQFTAARTVGDVPGPVTQTLAVLNQDFFFLLDGGVLIAVFATAAATLRFGVFARWFGFLSLAVGVVFVTPAFAVAFPAFGGWIVVLSVLTLRAQTQEDPHHDSQGPHRRPPRQVSTEKGAPRGWR
jgi:hypothetical protein